ncbi:MAG: hypothetical protein QM767_12075 [Anaeromyxobacter sp.]
MSTGMVATPSASQRRRALSGSATASWRESRTDPSSGPSSSGAKTFSAVR